MKDVFAARASKAYWTLLSDLCDSMAETFHDCPETQDWALYIRNVVLTQDEAGQTQFLNDYVSKIQTPLKKGCAKYARAVHSITGSPATVYQALSYHDIAAAHVSCDLFSALDLPTKLASERMADPKTKDVFWEYIDELNKNAHVALRKPLPRVPTTQEIAADIESRRASTGGGGGPLPPAAATLGAGIGDVWKGLCASRQVATPSDPDAAAKRARDFFEAREGKSEGGAVGECRAKSSALESDFLARFEELGDAPLTAEQWSLLERIATLSGMGTAIPDGMMRGIEEMASKLASDLQSGKADLGSLDLEAIGQNVLNGASQADVSAFAANLDKILPVLDQMQPPA